MRWLSNFLLWFSIVTLISLPSCPAPPEDVNEPVIKSVHSVSNNNPTAHVADPLLIKLKKGEVLKVGAKGENVRRLQKFLEITGFYKGEVDGEFGWETKKALLSFQRVFELPTTGYVDSKCAEFINSLIVEAAYGNNKNEERSKAD